MRFISSPSCTNLALLSQIEPNNLSHVSEDKSWLKEMNEEMDQIENDTWELVPRPKEKKVIGTKWVFKNKINEEGQVIGNTIRLVCRRYAQIEGIYFEETFAAVLILEAIKMFLAFSIHKTSSCIIWT